MNFVLMLYICGISTNICMPPLQNEIIFDDWYTCMVTGHTDALETYMNLEVKRVNQEQLAIGFECLEIKGDVI